MSGICGILRLDGAPPQGIQAMTHHLEQRGPEGTRHFHHGPCALGHTLLATTPEAVVEAMPLTHAPTGCTITADIRLDNRDVLLSALGLPTTGRIVGDGEIALHAYLKWGEDCPTHLLGDFAFAIWDPRAQRIFAARDHMGVKQLIHSHVDGKIWAFASAPSAVLQATDVPRRLNEGRIADFLEDYLEAIDFTSTFFEDVFRLPPAHCLIVGPSGLRISRYWTQQRVANLHLKSDAAYAEAFLEVFDRAVQDRLRAPPGSVGSMLSGGMDSGSIVAVAADIFTRDGRGAFPVFSAVGPDPATSRETRAIRSSQTVANLLCHEVNWANLDPWKHDLINLARNSEEPFEWSQTLVRSVYLAAKRSGIKIVLDGKGGDLVLTPANHIARLLARGKFGQVLHHARGEADYWLYGARPRDTVMRALRGVLVPDWLRHLRASWRQRTRRIDSTSLVHPNFAARVDLVGRINRWEGAPQGWTDHQGDKIRVMNTTQVAVGIERYDRISAEMGIESRDPYFDLRVISLLQSMPGDQMIRDGWPKFVQRRAMQGKLPDDVRWCPGKDHLGPDFLAQLMREYGAQVPSKACGSRFFSAKSAIPPALVAGQDASIVQFSFEVVALYALTDWFGENPSLL
jgi:asparagine synthase (glutamine-hydrolysing)